MNISVSDVAGQRSKDGLATIRLAIPGQQGASRLDIGIGDLISHSRYPLPIALDLLLVAGSCYAADKLVPRDSAEDRWTRHLEMTLPVSDPDRWQAVSEALEEALGFLSGDVWSLRFVRTSGSVYRRPARKRRAIPPALVFRPDAVCLFSGGLDSLAGAIDLLESEGRPKVLLVGHYDAPTGEQVELLAPIQRAYPGRVRQVRTRIRLDPVAGAESTLRTRSFVFLALAAFAASATGADVPVYAYENGHIALNVPLTPSRAGSCSTRTMHPYFLDKLEGVLGGIGIDTPIIRPYEMKTKGECVAECCNPSLLGSLATMSVSCSHPSRRQHWVRTGALNCGYCVPCMIRRGAMHRVGSDDGQQYGLDVCAGELLADAEGESANDLRSMLDFLRQRKSVAALAAQIQEVATVDRLAERAGLIWRGFDEVRSLIANKGNPAIKAMAGVRERP